MREPLCDTTADRNRPAADTVRQSACKSELPLRSHSWHPSRRCSRQSWSHDRAGRRSTRSMSSRRILSTPGSEDYKHYTPGLSTPVGNNLAEARCAAYSLALLSRKSAVSDPALDRFPAWRQHPSIGAATRLAGAGVFDQSQSRQAG